MGENLHREKQTRREAVLAFVEYARVIFDYVNISNVCLLRVFFSM